MICIRFGISVCKVLGNYFIPSIVVRGLRAPQLLGGKMAGHGDPALQWLLRYLAKNLHTLNYPNLTFAHPNVIL